MKTTIIGLGRFGYCLAKILQSQFEINFIDTQAIECQLPQIDYPQLVESDHVFLCVPINQLQSTLEKITPYLKKGATVLDTCSVKLLPCQWMTSILPNNVELIATHPLFGPDSEQAIHTIIMHPLRCDDDRFNFWVDTFKSFNLEPHQMAPEKHDQTIGVTQSLTHYIGRLLGGISRPDTCYQTLGYQKLCDVQQQTCHDQWQLFMDILKFNPYNKALLNAIENQQQSLQTVLNSSEVEHGQ